MPECDDAVLQEKGTTYIYQISYEYSKAPECEHLEFRFSNFY